MKVVFSHGKESGPWGSKIKALAKVAKQLGCEVDSIDYRGIESPDERVQKLSDYLHNETKISEPQPIILVGSSMGGYVSLVCAQQYQAISHNNNKQLQGVFLLAPALYMSGYLQQEYQVPECQAQKYDNIKTKIEIIHGWSDDIIPIEHSIKYAEQTQCTLHLIDGDHRLNSSLHQVIELFNVFLKKSM
jgi:surfactin synthase thioesterase subunit